LLGIDTGARDEKEATELLILSDQRFNQVRDSIGIGGFVGLFGG
jgi:hypothetical protein